LAAPGYKFAGWNGLLGIASNSVSLQLRGPLTLTAMFEAQTISLAASVKNSALQISARGLTNQVCSLQRSTDLATWQEIGTVTFDANGSASQEVTVDPAAPPTFFQLRIAP
jgi:hypothetical protein